MGFQVIATVNPIKLNQQFVDELIIHGTTIIRLNGAHVEIDKVREIVNHIRNLSKNNIKVLLDIPGTKIRTSGLYQSIQLKQGEIFSLSNSNFNFPIFISYLKSGDIVVSSDGQLKMKVHKICDSNVEFMALCDGELLNNKGIHLSSGDLSDMPFLSERDYSLIKVGKETGIDYVGFSFPRNLKHVRECCSLLKNSNCLPIIKLETKEIVNQNVLDEVIAEADVFLIDRGDLASEVGFEKFAPIFNRTLNTVLESGKDIYIATQVFASMCKHNLPYLSEIIEFDRLYNAGVTGIQLSEEIAIGENPIEVLKLIQSLIKGEE